MLHLPPHSIAERERPSQGIPHRRWLIAFLLAFGVLVNYFDRVNLSVAKQALERDFGITNITFGYLLSAYNWTYAALQLPMGVLLDRFGVQAVGRISAILWSLACFAGAFSPGGEGVLRVQAVAGHWRSAHLPLQRQSHWNVVSAPGTKPRDRDF